MLKTTDYELAIEIVYYMRYKNNKRVRASRAFLKTVCKTDKIFRRINMKKKRRLLALVLAVLLVACSGAVLAACAPPEPGSENKFTFSGEVTIAEKEYVVELKGFEGETANKGNFEMWVSDIPVPLEGNYEFVAKKGYIFTFADAGDTVVKTHYDSTNKKFYFDYFLNIGSSGGGIGKAKLSMADDAFASIHDGLDWGWDIVWYGESKNVLIAGNDCSLLITCKPDGTFITVPNSPMIAVPAREGTWELSSVDNQYTFTCSANYSGQVYKSTYNAAADEYSVSMHFNVGMAVQLTAKL